MKISIDPSIQSIPYYPKAALYGADSGWTLLSSNENPYPPSPRVIEDLVNAVFDINRYPGERIGAQGRLLAGKYGLKPENFVIGNGSNEIIEASLAGHEIERADAGRHAGAELCLLSHRVPHLRLRADCGASR